MNYGLDKVLEKYQSKINSAAPTKIGVVDDGVSLDSNEVIINSSWDIDGKKPDTISSSGHGWEVAKRAASFAPNKIEIVSLRHGGSHWSVLNGLDKAKEFGCKDVVTSIHIDQNVMIPATMERMRMASINWATHYSHDFNYPSYYVSSGVIEQFSKTFADFGRNILVAIPCDSSGKILAGKISQDIPSIGVLENAPSWAAPILASASAFLKLIEPSITYDQIREILISTSKPFDRNFGLLQMDKAVEMLTGESLTSTKVPIAKTIKAVHIHYSDGSVEIKS